MIRESHNWFAYSAVRINAYREIAKLIDFTSNPNDEGEDDLDSSGVPLKLTSPCETHWLVFADALERTLGQYDALGMKGVRRLEFGLNAQG